MRVTSDELASALAEAGEPTYVFRIERSLGGLDAAQSFYVNLDTQRALHIVADGDDTFTLTELPVADVIYAGIVEAAGIWPETHPALEPDATAPGEDSLVVTLVVHHHDGDGLTERELSWVDDEGVWLLDDDKLVPSSDYALYQRIPPLLHVLDR